MARVIPIKDLKDNASISRMCRESDEPVYIAKLAQAEDDIRSGKVTDARTALKALREKYDL